MISNCPNEEWLKHIELLSLEKRQVRGDMIKVYKIMHGADRVEREKFSPFSCSHEVLLHPGARKGQCGCVHQAGRRRSIVHSPSKAT